MMIALRPGTVLFWEVARLPFNALLAMFSTKNTFTDEQRAAILALDKKPEAEETAAAPAPATAGDDFAAEYAAAEGAAK